MPSTGGYFDYTIPETGAIYYSSALFSVNKVSSIAPVTGNPGDANPYPLTIGSVIVSFTWTAPITTTPPSTGYYYYTCPYNSITYYSTGSFSISVSQVQTTTTPPPNTQPNPYNVTAGGMVVSFTWQSPMVTSPPSGGYYYYTNPYNNITYYSSKSFTVKVYASANTPQDNPYIVNAGSVLVYFTWTTQITTTKPSGGYYYYACPYNGISYYSAQSFSVSIHNI